MTTSAKALFYSNTAVMLYQAESISRTYTDPSINVKYNGKTVLLFPNQSWSEFWNMILDIGVHVGGSDPRYY